MPVSPVNTTTANNIVTNPVTTQPASTTDLSNSQSSMSSYQTTGILTAVWNLISGKVEVARSFLATLPFIGRLFEAAPPAVRNRSEDELRYNAIKEILIFDRPQSNDHPSPVDAVRSERLAEALNVFRQIQGPFYKAKAFERAIIAQNSTDDAARQFYNALPDQLQRDFREQIYIANGRNDNNHGIGFGEHIVATEIRGVLARTAAEHLKIAQNPSIFWHGRERGPM